MLAATTESAKYARKGRREGRVISLQSRWAKWSGSDSRGKHIGQIRILIRNQRQRLDKLRLSVTVVHELGRFVGGSLLTIRGVFVHGTHHFSCLGVVDRSLRVLLIDVRGPRS